jgi:magnesium transporter
MPDVVLRWLDQAGQLQVAGSDTTADVEAAFASGATWVWADVVGPEPGTLDALSARFHFHELAVEDTVHEQRRAKIDQYPDGLFLVWLTPEHPRGDSVVVSELDVFVGKNYLVTVHTSPSKAVDLVVGDAPRSMQAGPAWVLHKIIDLLVDSTLPLVDKVGEQLSAIEDKMLDNPRQDDLRALHRVRRQLVRLHRVIAPERDLLRGLARESDVISEEAYRYFQDVGDHVARALDSVETYQDVGASVMDVYLSAQSNRMNEIMKQLTVVATIFMPLSLITGIYGMNLTAGMWPPPVESAWWAFWIVMGWMVILSVAMAVYFRKKNWW